jgi:hypothetical protein
MMWNSTCRPLVRTDEKARFRGDNGSFAANPQGLTDHKIDDDWRAEYGRIKTAACPYIA